MPPFQWESWRSISAHPSLQKEGYEMQLLQSEVWAPSQHEGFPAENYGSQGWKVSGPAMFLTAPFEGKLSAHGSCPTSTATWPRKKIVWPSGYKFVHVLNEFLSILLLVGYGTMTCISKGPCDIKCSRRCFLAIWIIYFRGNVIWQTHVVNSLPTVTDVRTQKGRKSKLQVLKHFTLLPFHFIFLDRFLRSSGSLQTSKRVWRLLWTLIFWSTGIVGVYHKAFFSTVIF